MLEERRVFHAGAIVAPTEAAPPPPPPPPTTTVTLDAGQNLLVQDASAGGQNDQLSIRLDSDNGWYEIYDPNQVLQTDIAGAAGNGTNRLYIPVEVVTGDKLIFQTGAGDDSLAVDLSEGLGGKSLVFDGGAGEQDSLTLRGGSYAGVGYLFADDGSTQIEFAGADGNTGLRLTGVEPIFDYLAADSRQFTIGAGLSGLTLGDDGVRRPTACRSLRPRWERALRSRRRLHSLTLGGPGQRGASFAGGQPGWTPTSPAILHLQAGGSGQVELSGQINLHGGDLRASGDTIRVSGSVITRQATIDLSARSPADGHGRGRAGECGAASAARCRRGRHAAVLRADRRPRPGRGPDRRHGPPARPAGRVLGTASIDASGVSGGGTVLVGGDYQGAQPADPQCHEHARAVRDVDQGQRPGQWQRRQDHRLGRRGRRSSRVRATCRPAAAPLAATAD